MKTIEREIKEHIEATIYNLINWGSDGDDSASLKKLIRANVLFIDALKHDGYARNLLKEELIKEYNCIGVPYEKGYITQENFVKVFLADFDKCLTNL